MLNHPDNYTAMQNHENYMTMHNYFKNLIDRDELEHKITVYIEFEIITWVDGGYGICGVLAINPQRPFKHFPKTDNNKVYETAAEAQAAAQKWYAKELITVIPNLALEENIIPLPFNGGYVELEISLTISKHQNTYKSVGMVKQRLGFHKYVILDKFKFDNLLGVGTYNSVDYTFPAAYDIFQLVLMNNLALSCNKCKHAINDIANYGARICRNTASLFCDCVMDRVDDGCNSFEPSPVVLGADHDE